jgi:hypothetical protein
VVLVCGCLAYSNAINADDSVAAKRSFRAGMLKLLTDIHNVDSSVRSNALRELEDIGVSEGQLKFARLLKHPNRLERMRLVGLLPKAPGSLRKELVLELLRDTDVAVRTATFNQLKPVDIDVDLIETLEERATAESDAVFKARVVRAVTEIKQRQNSGDVNPKSQEVQSANYQRNQKTPSAVQPTMRSRPQRTIPRAAARQSDPQSTANSPGRVFDPNVVAADYYESESQRRQIELVKRETSNRDAAPRVLVPPKPADKSNDNQLPAVSLPLPDQDVDRIFQEGGASPDFPLPFSDSASPTDRRRPGILDRPLAQPMMTRLPQYQEGGPLLRPPIDAPFGFTGRSGILPTEEQTSSHFVPQEDRWRNGYTPWDRYKRRHPWVDDYPGVEGHWWDPYNQNVLKGDYPIIGQHTFFNVTATSQTAFDFRQVPTATTPFESTRGFDQREFFGQAEQTTLLQNLFVRMDLFHGNQTGFKPLDWQIRITPVVNMNSNHVDELSVLNPDGRTGRTRFRDHFILQEYFAEVKLADISPDYDFASLRVGSQFFNSDFRGFIFFDTNRGARLFGSRLSNRHQFNLTYFDMQEKETNSQLNTFGDRHQNVLAANYYIQDFVFPGYTFQTSFHWNHDQPGRKFDRNDFLVRPDPTGVFQPHRVEAYYFGVAGDGHMGRINVNNAFYWVTGRDSLNPIGGQSLNINAFMAALEVSYDRDWARFRASIFWASGDDNPNDNDGEGFDAIMDNPLFGGGEFTYWQRQAIQLFGVRLVNDRSLVPNLRSSKTQGQSNFTNPGLFLFNLGFDADITPKIRLIANMNYLMFDETEVLQAFTFQGDISKEIGLDLSVGFEYRPFHNDNMIMLFGVSSLIPDDGFKDLYNQYNSGDTETLFASFFEMILQF